MNEALKEFAISAERDFTECDKIYIHVQRLKASTGYNAYVSNAKSRGIKPISFEQFIKA